MRPQFDAFFASLDEASRGVFLDDALAIWHSCMDDGKRDDLPSMDDCMETAYDRWRTFAAMPDSAFSSMETARAIRHLMIDPERITRERGFRNVP